MTTKLPIAELKAQDPARYKREYEKYVEDQYNWFDADYIRDDFTTQLEEKYGMAVSDISWDTYYGAAAFAAKMPFWKWLEITNRAETHLPVYLWAEETEECFKTRPPACSTPSMGTVSWDWWRVGEPLGVFKDLPEEDWAKLISESIDELEGDIETWLEERASELLEQVRAAEEDQTSEESFERYCEDMGIMFEVEDEEGFV